MGEQELYHRGRERQCREMAAKSDDPEVRRAHEELAELHASFLARHAAKAEGRPANA